MNSARRLFILLASVAALLAGGPSVAEACTCMLPNPACQAVWQSSDVFVGQVVSIDASPADKLPFLSKLVRIRATEVFRGGVAGEVEVWTGQGGGDCGYDFKVGETYLVYTWRHPENKRITTGICSRTRPLSRAAADLVYLRSLARDTSKFGRITGTATRIDLPPAGQTEGQRNTPFAGARVMAEGGGRTYEARTSADGTYEIAVPPGSYTLRVDVPDGLYALSGTRVIVEDARGCADNTIGVYPDGRIAGRLVSADREPVPHFALELMPVSRAGSEYFFPSPDERVRTDDRGLYELKRLRPGVYYIGYGLRRDRGADPTGARVLLTDDTGVPRMLTVPSGGRVNVEDLALPASVKLVSVSGIVLDEAGAAAVGAMVYVKTGSGTDTIGPAVVTSRDGRFTLALIADRSYSLLAEGFDDAGRFIRRAEGPAFTAHLRQGSGGQADYTGITLTLRPNR